MKQGWYQLYFYSKWRAVRLYELIRPRMYHPNKSLKDGT